VRAESFDGDEQRQGGDGEVHGQHLRLAAPHVRALDLAGREVLGPVHRARRQQLLLAPPELFISPAMSMSAASRISAVQIAVCMSCAPQAAVAAYSTGSSRCGSG
jgi:hypothetical protein